MVNKKLATYGIVAVVLLLAVLGLMSFVTVNTGNVKVVTNQGAVTGEILGPGWYIINPITEGTQSLSVRPQEYTMSSTTGEGDRTRDDQVNVLTQDGLEVGIDITVRYSINANEADVFYTEYRNQQQAEQRLIRPSIRSELRTEAGDVETSNIYTKEGQERLRNATIDVLEQEFNGTGLTLNAVQIRAVDLPQEYQASIEDKEVEEQRLQREQTRIERAELEKERQRIEAEASAEQVRIRGEALRENPIVIESRRVEALRNATTIYVPMGSGNQTSPVLTREANDAGGE